MSLTIEKQREKALEPYAAVFNHIDRHENESVEAVRSFLRIPGFSDTGEGITESANAALSYLTRISAVDAKLVDTPGHPVVTGKSYSKNPNARTIAVYCLYDETPVDQSEWRVNPIGAEIVDAPYIGLPAEIGKVICSRATYNHRGPMLSLILALKAMQEVEGDIPVNILWVWEGEEEIGSPNLHVFMDQYERELRQCEGLYQPYMQESPEGTMLIWRGKKGALLVELECKGGEWGGTVDGRHTWSGAAPFVDAPMMRLVQAVASLYDKDQNIAIDGVSEIVPPLNEEDRVELRRLQEGWNDDLDRMMKAQLSVHRWRDGKSVPELLERWVTSVGINLEGIVGGYTGPQYYSMLPQTARAKFDFRLPMGVTPDKLMALIRAHLDRRGFREIQIKNARGYEGYRSPIDTPVIQAAIRAAEAHGVPTSITPTSNSYCPVSVFAKPPFNLPSCSTGLGHGERPHQPEEYISVSAVGRYMKFAVAYLHELGKM